jgi:hypothetical protein
MLGITYVCRVIDLRMSSTCGLTRLAEGCTIPLVKPAVSALIATVLTAAVGFSGATAPAGERFHEAHACRTAAHRTCRAEGETGDRSGLHDAAAEASVSSDFTVNTFVAHASITNVRSAKYTLRRGAPAVSVVSKRPHDPLHLHTYSLLI